MGDLFFFFGQFNEKIYSDDFYNEGTGM